MIQYDSPVGDIAHAQDPQDSQDSVPAACAAWAAWYWSEVAEMVWDGGKHGSFF